MSSLASSPEHQVDHLIAELRTKFVHHEAFEDLQVLFERHLRKRRAALSLGQEIEARCLAILGASGSGKTTAADRLLKHHPKLKQPREGEEVAEVIQLQVPSPTTLKFVGSTMLNKLGYPLKRDQPANVIWDKVRDLLRDRRTLFVHLDEAQHLYTNKGTSARNDVVDTLKILMNNKAWPVGLVLSGTLDLAAMIESDVQLLRRSDIIRLKPVTWTSHGDEIGDLFSSFVRKAGLSHRDGLDSPDFLKRLFHAGGNEFGTTFEIILCGIEEALYSGDTVLTCRHYAEAFRRRMACIPAFNPFVADDFLTIDVRRLGDQ